MADYPADRIFAPAGSVKALADEGATPFFLYDAQGLRDSVRALHGAFSWQPGYQNYFPLRENPNPHLLKLLCEAGTGVSACSRLELRLAIQCGFSGEQLLYEPSRADPEAETLAKEADALWLCNSEWLIPEDPPNKLILRYHPVDLRLPPPQKQAVSRNKLGLSREDLLRTASRLRAMGLSQIGLAMQVSGYSINPGFWGRKASILVQLSQQIRSETGMEVWCCHLGEGPGLPYHPRVEALSLPGEANQVRGIWDSLPETERPIFYTGVSSRVMEPYGILVTKILEQRYNYRTFLILDAGICQYLRPALKQAYRHISVLGRSQIEDRKLYSLVGELPDPMDRLAHKGRMLPKVTPGEYCVVHDVGCGARSMAMLYGAHPVAAEYLYEADGTIHPIAPRRTEEDVLRFLTAW